MPLIFIYNVSDCNFLVICSFTHLSKGYKQGYKYQLFSAESTGVYWFQQSSRTRFWPIICEFPECWQQIESGNDGYVQEGTQHRQLPSLYRCTAAEENNKMYLSTHVLKRRSSLELHLELWM